MFITIFLQTKFLTALYLRQHPTLNNNIQLQTYSSSQNYLQNQVKHYKNYKLSRRKRQAPEIYRSQSSAESFTTHTNLQTKSVHVENPKSSIEDSNPTYQFLDYTDDEDYSTEGSGFYYDHLSKSWSHQPFSSSEYFGQTEEKIQSIDDAFNEVNNNPEYIDEHYEYYNENTEYQEIPEYPELKNQQDSLETVATSKKLSALNSKRLNLNSPVEHKLEKFDLSPVTQTDQELFDSILIEAERKKILQEIDLLKLENIDNLEDNTMTIQTLNVNSTVASPMADKQDSQFNSTVDAQSNSLENVKTLQISTNLENVKNSLVENQDKPDFTTISTILLDVDSSSIEQNLDSFSSIKNIEDHQDYDTSNLITSQQSILSVTDLIHQQNQEKLNQDWPLILRFPYVMYLLLAIFVLIILLLTVMMYFSKKKQENAEIMNNKSQNLVETPINYTKGHMTKK